MKTILSQSFFNRPTLQVAEELLGKFLVREKDGVQMSLVIREVEAYDGFEDRASHAHRGETPRNRVMFGPAGVWYVYLVYGMHWMLNVVTGKAGYPAAVLIRGAGKFAGPARLTKALGIDRAVNEQPVSLETGLWIEDRGTVCEGIQKAPRVGVAYAGKEWASKPYRFFTPC